MNKKFGTPIERFITNQYLCTMKKLLFIFGIIFLLGACNSLKRNKKKQHLIVIPYKYVVETSNKQNAFPRKAFLLFIK